MTTPLITMEKLRAAGACKSQFKLFLRLFPTGKTRVTKALCLQHAYHFQFAWASWALLNEKGRAIYSKCIAPACKAHDGRRADLDHLSWGSDYRDRLLNASYRQLQLARAEAFYRAWAAGGAKFKFPRRIKD